MLAGLLDSQAKNTILARQIFFAKPIIWSPYLAFKKNYGNFKILKKLKDFLKIKPNNKLFSKIVILGVILENLSEFFYFEFSDGRVKIKVYNKSTVMHRKLNPLKTLNL